MRPRPIPITLIALSLLGTGLLVPFPQILLPELGISPVAHARSKRRTRIMARALFRQAAKAFTKENYPAALQLFTESYELKKKNIVLYNIAMCHRALFHYKESIAAFRKYLARRGKRLPSAKRQKIQRLILEMTGKLVKLRLKIKPPGAVVKIDGRMVGAAPFDGPLELNPGRHTLEVLDTGHRTESRTLSFTDGEKRTLSIHLKPIRRFGFVTLTARAAGAMVKAPHKKPKPLPATLKLPAGETKLKITAPGHRPRELAVVVKPNEASTVPVKLEPTARRRARRLLLPKAQRPRTRRTHSPGTGAGDAAPPGKTGESPPVYKRWWFWTIIGAVVVGGAAAGGVLGWQATQEEPMDMRVTLR